MNIAEILELVKTSQGKSVDEIVKNFVQPGGATTGIQGYDLEAPSKKLYPVLTPLRNRIPRRGGGFAVQANWKAITGIRSAARRAGVSEGNRGSYTQHTSAEYLAAYRGIGGEKYVTFEADYAAQNFEDVKALAVSQALENLMIDEELIILGGNTSLAYGQPNAPTLVGSTTGGTLAAATWSVIVIGLSLQAYWDIAGLNNGNVNQSFDATTAAVVAQDTRTNADGSVDLVNMGVSRRSNNATVVTTGATSSIQATAAAIPGVVAWAWYWGPAGTERLGALTTINSVLITAATGGANQLASVVAGAGADRSQNSLEFDGLLTIASKGLGSYYVNMPTGTPGTGTPLTAGSGRVVEIDAALADYYRKYRIQPNEIHMSYVQFVQIGKLVLGSTNPGVTFMIDPTKPIELVAGRNVGKYLSPINGQIIDMIVHPNMVPGTILFNTTAAPAYLDGVQDIVRIRTRREYFQIEWPIRTRKYEYGVYADEVLQHFFPPALGIITNIA